ncbi:class I SAM-dependent methyltransferase [Candidatus Zixiibacteriota bacterium]
MNIRYNSIKACLGLLVILTGWPTVTLAGMQQGALEPENSNEARLNQLQPPDQVMDATGIQPGMTVAEIGAGRGRYIVQLAVRVGEKGKVYAEDINSPALQYCENRCRRWELDHVETIRGDVADPKLPEAELDVIFMISSYHEFTDPVALMRKARPALKADGYVALVEWLPPENSGPGSLTPDKIEAQFKEAGYRLERTDRLLEANDLLIYIFRPDGR